MTAAMTRPGFTLLPPEFVAGRPARSVPRAATTVTRVSPSVYARVWTSPAVSTARLTIGQPPRPRIFEHETSLN